MTATPQDSPYQGPFGVVRRLDDAIYAVEQAIVWSFLSAMTVMVALDVIYRRLVAPDSKVADLIARIFGVTDPEQMAFLTGTVAPAVSLVGGVGILWFGLATAERHRHGADASKTRPIVETIVVGAFLAGLGWLMTRPEVPSRYFYLLLMAIGVLIWAKQVAAKRADGWRTQLVAIIALGAPFTYIALNHFPDGYSWSKELSLMMLLWVGFLGASICAHQGKHLRLEALNRLVPASMERWVRAAGNLATAGACAFLAALGYIYVREAMELEGRFEQTNIPDWIPMAAIPAAFALTMARYIGGAISALLGGSYGEPAEDESLAAAQAATKAQADA